MNLILGPQASNVLKANVSHNYKTKVFTTNPTMMKLLIILIQHPYTNLPQTYEMTNATGRYILSDCRIVRINLLPFCAVVKTVVTSKNSPVDNRSRCKTGSEIATSGEALAYMFRTSINIYA